MVWRVYRWDDAGAPDLSATGNSLIWLLDAVLIGTGGIAYGSKPSAGWTGAHLGGDSVAKYVNAGSGHGIKVTHAAASNSARIVGCEFGNDSAGPFFPTEAQVSGGLYMHLSSTTDSTARPWIILADSKRFYLWIGYSQTEAQGTTTTNGMMCYFAGDIQSEDGADGFPFMLIAGTAAGSSAVGFAGNSSGYTGTLSGHYMARSSAYTGGSYQVLKMADYSGSGSTTMGSAGFLYPAFGGGLRLCPVRVVEPLNNVRGVMPGLWCPMHPLPGNPGDTFDGTGALTGKTFILLDVANAAARGRMAFEISDTVV